MYESTPQHVIDEESHPGLLADMLGSSSSSDTSSSSNDSDTDESSGSQTTAKRIRRALRGRRRRKSSASSKETPSFPSAVRTPSAGTFSNGLDGADTLVEDPTDNVAGHGLGAITSGDEADTDGEGGNQGQRIRRTTINHRDFESGKTTPSTKPPELKSKKKPKRKHHKVKNHGENRVTMSEKVVTPNIEDNHGFAIPPSPRVSFRQDVQIMSSNSPKRPFNIRGISVRPAIPKMLTSTVFSAANPTGSIHSGAPLPTALPGALSGLRRTNSLPDRLNKTQTVPNAQALPHLMPTASNVSLRSNSTSKVKKHISQTSAITLLLISTGLVAVCANFLVDNISYLIENTSVSEAFIGLIILPMVGNAAEHVTAVTVASKNKMDLAIGVAVGSSIQIALFVTPVIVLLGWILGKDMSLYFSLFETVSLFVAAFIVNFLVLDGRSNYLEGALLIAAYIIIGVAAFFYPDSSEQSTIGGADPVKRMMLKLL